MVWVYVRFYCNIYINSTKEIRDTFRRQVGRPVAAEVAELHVISTSILKKILEIKWRQKFGEYNALLY